MRDRAKRAAYFKVYAKAYNLKHKEKHNLQRQHRRRVDVAWAICVDARKADRRGGREHDLDRPFVSALISGPCEYCGDQVLRRTVDRIDNSLGHLRTNVVCACERCNYVRRDMPYQAWLVLSQAMRDAREQGLFGEWTGAIHRRGPLAPLPTTRSNRSPHGTLAGYKRCGPPRCQDCKNAMAAWKRKRRNGP